MNVYNIVEDAIETGHMKDLLSGKNGYEIGFNQYISAVAPTDWTIVVPEIYKLASEHPNLKIKEKFESTIFEMFLGDYVDIYSAMGVMYFQLLREESNRAGFSINRACLLDQARKVLRKQEIHDAEIVLQNNTIKIWPEIERYIMLMRKKWNIELI